MKELWNNSLKILFERMPPGGYRGYFDQVSYVSGNESNIVLSVPSTFLRDRIVDRFLPDIKEVLHELTGRDVEVAFTILNYHMEKRPATVTDERVRISEGLNPRYTFENFIVSSCNQLAHAASVAVASSPGKAYNPLFIYGGVGLGKTHLLNATGRQLLGDPSLRVFFLSAEKFTNEFIYCMKTQRMEEFRRKFRDSCDALLIDDIQFIAGMEKTQEEFFHTFNSLYETHRQIVISSDKIPQEIPNLEERLRSRFTMGLIADIQPPDLETRVAIVKKKCEAEKIDMPDEVAFFLASKAQSNIRELEGFITRIHALSSLKGLPVTIDLAKDELRDLIPKQRSVTVEDIENAVSTFFNVKPSDLKSHRRMKVIAFPRQIAMYLCRELTPLSYPEIGQKFGGKDHSTIVHAVNKIKQLCNEDPSMRNTVDALIKNIKSRYV